MPEMGVTMKCSKGAHGNLNWVPLRDPLGLWVVDQQESFLCGGSQDSLLEEWLEYQIRTLEQIEELKATL